MLTRDQLVDAALGLLDRHGPTGLSMRRLADELGVHPNALYTYVADRAALERAIADRLLRLADPSLLDGPQTQWRERLLAFARSTRAVLRLHPGAMDCFLNHPLPGDADLDIGEAMLRCFVDAGLAPEDASRATYVASLYVLGFTAFDIAETSGIPPLPDDLERAAARAAALGDVDAERHPLMAATAATAATWVDSATYEWGLDRLIDGLTGSVPCPGSD